MQLKSKLVVFVFLFEWISSHLIPLCHNKDADFVTSAEKAVTPEYFKASFQTSSTMMLCWLCSSGIQHFFFWLRNMIKELGQSGSSFIFQEKCFLPPSKSHFNQHMLGLN